MLLFIKLLKKKAIYWGHGTDLYGGSALWLKRFANDIEYSISDAIILYGEHLRKNLSPRHHNKIFIANNTLNFDEDHRGLFDKSACLSKYSIQTTKNIICMGRLQRRKRLESLFEAFRLLGRSDIGLIFVGPDSDGVLSSFNGDNIYKLGAIYGDEKLNLLSAADVFCLPGAVGLSIVDAFYCGLPLVTDDGDISPESMYLKDGINGYVVPKGDIRRLAMRLQMLLDDDVLRERFSRAAKKEISTNGHIETMCKGFLDALYFVCHVSFRGSGRRPVF
ncbi:MAG: GDP-mannose-dependent alpha-(1-6)-phosphatidylinositol monomannoside mannosyltransferase [Syntrophorhabdus sp. PtaU1.Bin050]|nr:MAG: GDP-mannose-dependent alpha-(1-6)-phosphatidylinositol monomannoside mannosyltransferase [Syntrophorhabdus sp. PtaU1.Bin050]